MIIYVYNETIRVAEVGKSLNSTFAFFISNSTFAFFISNSHCGGPQTFSITIRIYFCLIRVKWHLCSFFVVVGCCCCCCVLLLPSATQGTGSFIERCAAFVSFLRQGDPAIIPMSSHRTDEPLLLLASSIVHSGDTPQVTRSVYVAHCWPLSGRSCSWFCRD